MKSIDFVMWLKGFMDCKSKASEPMTAEQCEMITKKLSEVHICSSFSDVKIVGKVSAPRDKRIFVLSPDEEGNVQLSGQLRQGISTEQVLKEQTNSNASASNKVIGDVFLMNITGL